jgi:hypothetical protein
MTFRGWSAVDQDHLDISLGDQRVSEGKPARTPRPQPDIRCS